MNIAMVEKPVLSARAWRVTFRVPASEADFGSLVPDAPRPLVAVREEFDVTEALDAASPETESTEFVIIWAPPGATSVERRVESWVGAQSPLLRASISTIRVVWSNNRAMFFCAPEPSESGYDAVVRFTVIMREAAALDEQMASVWRSMNEHVRFAVGSPAWSKRKEINLAAKKAVETKMALLRTQTSLEQLDAKLASTSKRLCAEMILAANLHDRLEVMEDPLQFANDRYEIVNARLIESNYARKGLWMEVLIALLLAMNTGAILMGSEPPSSVKVVSDSNAPDDLMGDKNVNSVDHADKGAVARPANTEHDAVPKPPDLSESAVEKSAADTTAATAETGATNIAMESPPLTANRLTGDFDAEACQGALSSLDAGDKIRFSRGASLIQRSSAQALRQVAAIVKRCRNVVIEVKVPTQSSRDDDSNFKVARGRALAVVSQLRREGVTTSLLRSVVIGARKPIASNSSTTKDGESGEIEFMVKRQR
jgi:outer membrane protein OmpA-like peptidoglycan-associated protein